ncbi:PREDICTED: putative potassium transport protein DDB_G0292412 [Bactrocera latifrons]|nr:PREDICTED: putative potassium transport protein DDB_G0292412 [Bactrocera latifrons]
MEDETQTQQQQLQQHEEHILQQAQGDDQQDDRQTEVMKTVTALTLSDEDCVTETDSATYMCVQEEGYEQESSASNADALQQLEVQQQHQQAYAQQRSQKPTHHRQYNPKKSVSFKTLVDIFQLSDAWQLHVKKSSLKTEEDQAKRRILQRNY